MSRTSELASAGVSIWLDDLSRARLDSGSLAELIHTHNVVGVTTNPAIFANSITNDTSYDAALRDAQQEGLSVEDTITRLTTDDVRRACDVFADVYRDSDGVDGRVSIEVEPEYAHDTEGTVRRAQELWRIVDRPNAMIKIPATAAGIEAISDVIASGISVNVTLIFGIPRYRDVANAYLLGLERARNAGLDISKIHSVASFFVSRVDTAVDAKLDAAGTPEAAAMKGAAGIANARVAYEAFAGIFSSARARYLVSQGAHVQRLLWASTGVKNPDYPDTMYVTNLVAPDVVNTMPEATLNAVADHAEVTGDTINDFFTEANQALNELERFDIDYGELINALELEGLQKFEESWNGLIEELSKQFRSE